MRVDDALFAEMNAKRWPWTDVDVAPDNRSYYSVGNLTDAQVQELPSGAYVLGRSLLSLTRPWALIYDGGGPPGRYCVV